MVWVDVARTNYEEKMFWACLLRRAVFDYVLYRGSGKHKMVWQTSASFIFGNAEVEGLTFGEVCSLFGWEPEYLQRLTRRLTRESIKKLEAGKFKELFDEAEPEFMDGETRWETAVGVMPMLEKYNYSDAYREALRPRVVHRVREVGQQPSNGESGPRSELLPAPLLAWSAAR